VEPTAHAGSMTLEFFRKCSWKSPFWKVYASKVIVHTVCFVIEFFMPFPSSDRIVTIDVLTRARIPSIVSILSFVNIANARIHEVQRTCLASGALLIHFDRHDKVMTLKNTKD